MITHNIKQNIRFEVLSPLSSELVVCPALSSKNEASGRNIWGFLFSGCVGS